MCTPRSLPRQATRKVCEAYGSTDSVVRTSPVGAAPPQQCMSQTPIDSARRRGLVLSRWTAQPPPSSGPILTPTSTLASRSLQRYPQHRQSTPPLSRIHQQQSAAAPAFHVPIVGVPAFEAGFWMDPSLRLPDYQETITWYQRKREKRLQVKATDSTTHIACEEGAKPVERPGSDAVVGQKAWEELCRELRHA